MASRQPKPTALKLVTGNPGKRKLNQREPKPRRVIPSPPAHLEGHALRGWGALAANLDRWGVLTEMDALGLEQLCENYGEILELREDIRAHGRFQVVKTKSGDVMERTRPAQTQLADAERRFKAMLCEFGMTPSARSRVMTTNDNDRDKDPAASYFG